MKIARVLFQFNDACPNKCPFCYMPFDGKGVGNIELWLKIVNRLKDFNVELLSLAGGDPLYYDEFYEFVDKIDKFSYINLVTSGRFLDKEKYAKICKKIDSIGLPVDECDKMLKRQRFSQKVFDEVDKNIDYFKSVHDNITINTLVTPINKENLNDIGEYLVAKKLKIWNLYQYWGFDFMKNNSVYQMNDEEFYIELNKMKREFSGVMDVNGWTSTERKYGYFFVTSLGRVYTINKLNHNEYVFIGSIFDENIYEKWLIHNTSEESEKRFHIITDREIVNNSK